MYFNNQPTVSEINEFLEKINSIKNYLFNDWKANNIDVEENNSDAYRKIKKDFGALSNVYIYNVDSQTVDRHKNNGPPAVTEKGENMLRGTLSNFKSIDSGNVSSNIHFLGSEINLILKFDGCGHTDLIESHKVAIKQQTDELHNYCIQIEAEKEKSKITASEISVLKSEVVNFSGTMHNHCEHVTGLKPRNSSTEVDLSLQLDTLKVTIEDLLRQSMWSEKKIAELQEIKYTSERILNKTIDRIKDELNVLKTELENTKSELGCSQEIVKKKNYEKKCLMEKNESLTHDIDNLYKSLRDLKSEYFLSKEKSKENSKDKINDLEHESDRNYLHLQRIEEQGQDAAADIVIMAKNLNRLKRQNTALDLSIENILRPSIKTIDETKSYPNFGHLLSEQCGCGTSVCSMFDMALGTTIQHQNKLKMDGYSSDDDDNIPKCEKDEKIKKLQNKLNELEKAYISKAQRYEKIITKIDIEARKEKEYQQQIYKSNMKIKENQISDLKEGFRTYIRTKNEEIKHERNNFKDVKKQLKDQKTLLELEETNACGRMETLNKKYNIEREKVTKLSSRIDGLKIRPTVNNKPRSVDKKLAKVSKAGPSGDAKSKIPVIKVFNVGLKNQNVTKATKTKTPVVTSSCSSNKSNTPDYSPLLHMYNQKQQDKKISNLYENNKQQNATGIPKGQVYNAPSGSRWKL